MAQTTLGYITSLTAAHLHHLFLRIRRDTWNKFEMKTTDLQTSD